MVSGHEMASNGPFEPALGSLSRSKLRLHDPPPLLVVSTEPITATKQTLAVGQLIALEGLAIPNCAGELQLAAPSVVLVNVPVGLTAKHVVVVGQLIEIED